MGLVVLTLVFFLLVLLLIILGVLLITVPTDFLRLVLMIITMPVVTVLTLMALALATAHPGSDRGPAMAGSRNSPAGTAHCLTVRSASYDLYRKVSRLFLRYD